VTQEMARKKTNRLGLAFKVLVELGSIERWLESLVNKEPRNHEIDFVPPFIPPL